MGRFCSATCALLLASLGCSDEPNEDGGGLTAIFDTINSVVHVRNSGEAPVWSATPTARIGSVAGGPEEFGRIRSLVADAEGHVYVADNLAHEIRVFDPEGRHLRTVGRSGGGPGEFRDLYSLAWLEGLLAAVDPRNARISVLTTTGEWVEGIRHQPLSGPPTLIRLHPLGDGGFYTPVIDLEKSGMTLVRITGTGPADTILAPRPPEGLERTGAICRRPDGGVTGISVPEAPAVVYAFPPQGGEVAQSWTERYEVYFVTSEGDTTRVVERENAPPPYPDSLWALALEPYRELHRDYPGTVCDPPELTRPKARAAFRYLMFDERGRMWAEVASEEGFIWEIFDPEGRLLATAPAPPRSTAVPPYARGDKVYQVETDELGVQYVAVYQIGPAEPSLARSSR